MSKVPVILSGVQPSGDLHLGNYLGAIKQWVSMIDEYECYFCVVDLHALTDLTAVREMSLRTSTRRTAATYIAAGIDPSKSTVFVQSHVSEHAQLQWILNCLCPLGTLERMTQFKSKANRRESIDSGLLNYPVLMAADILLYATNIVPVGDDQQQHIELTRELGRKFNSMFGEVFVIPEARTPIAGARVMGLDNPGEKMSKSVGKTRPNHCVGMLDSPDDIAKKFARAVTDGETSVGEGPLSPGVRNLLDIYAASTGVSFRHAHEEFVGARYGDLKTRVADVVISVLTPFQRRFEDLMGDEDTIDIILGQGAEKARTRASDTLRRVSEALGL